MKPFNPFSTCFPPGDFCKALRIGLSRADGLELEVVDGDVRSFHGTGGKDVADGYPELVHRIALDDDSQVGGIDIAGGHTAAAHIIRGMARIVLLPPVVEAPVIFYAAVVVEVALRHVPFRLVGFGQRVVGQGGQSAGGERRLRSLAFAGIGGILLAEGQINAVDGSRLLPDESAQVDGVVVPLVDVLGLVLVQGKCFLVNQASGAAQFVGGFGRVGLEEGQHVLLEDAHHAQVHRVEVDGAEGDEQTLGVGQDGGFRPEFHLRFEM